MWRWQKIPATVRRPLRFGVFELNVRSGELRKAGTRIGVQEQPLLALALLLSVPESSFRARTAQPLWPDGTFVEYEHGLNAVINRLRDTWAIPLTRHGSLKQFRAVAIASSRPLTAQQRPESTVRHALCCGRHASPQAGRLRLRMDASRRQPSLSRPRFFWSCP